MADPFVAEIRIVGFNFAPRGWAFCNGQILPIAQNTALFSLLGTTYGGDGKSTFALPDLQGRTPMQPGQGNGLSLRDLGESGGSETVSLLETELPTHNHRVLALNASANLADPSGALWARSGTQRVYTSSAANVNMRPDAMAASGESAPHNNLQPYLTMNFIIALQGVFPPRQ